MVDTIMIPLSATTLLLLGLRTPNATTRFKSVAQVVVNCNMGIYMKPETPTRGGVIPNTGFIQIPILQLPRKCSQIALPRCRVWFGEAFKRLWSFSD